MAKLNNENFLEELAHMSYEQRIPHAKHNPDTRKRRDRSKAHSKQLENTPLPEATASLDLTIANLKQDKEAYQRFLINVMKAWHGLTTPQKIIVCVVMAAVAGCALYYIVQLLNSIETNLPSKETNLLSKETNLPSNRLTPDEQTEVNKRIKDKIGFDQPFWDRVKNNLPSTENPKLKAAYKKEQASYIKEVEDYKHSITEYLSKNAVTTRIQKGVLDQTEISIDITHKEGAGGGIAGYIGETKQFLFAVQPKTTRREAVYSFWNELHHAAISQQNRQLGCTAPDDLLADEPFCHNGHWDHHLLSIKLGKIISTGITKVNRLYKISKKISSNQAITDQEAYFHEKGVLTLTNYHPLTDSQVFTVTHFERSIEPYLKPIKQPAEYAFIFPKNILQKQYSSPIYCDMYINILRRIGDNIEVCTQTGNESDSHAIISALVTQLHMGRDSIFATNGVYGEKKMNYHSQVAELASDIDGLPVAIKQYFFREFCDYFTDYFNVNYCDYDDPPAYQLK